eukprot:GHVN01044757.1.p1 GENE.GHVN01044757.1~~GHVN01044757.1.p1  ORF type:complete len:674 (+),score=166.24 GHVN01044757.1:28-2022(+)
MITKNCMTFDNGIRSGTDTDPNPNTTLDRFSKRFSQLNSSTGHSCTAAVEAVGGSGHPLIDVMVIGSYAHPWTPEFKPCRERVKRSRGVTFAFNLFGDAISPWTLPLPFMDDEHMVMLWRYCVTECCGPEVGDVEISLSMLPIDERRTGTGLSLMTHFQGIESGDTLAVANRFIDVVNELKEPYVNTHMHECVKMALNMGDVTSIGLSKPILDRGEDRDDNEIVDIRDSDYETPEAMSFAKGIGSRSDRAVTGSEVTTTAFGRSNPITPSPHQKAPRLLSFEDELMTPTTWAEFPNPVHHLQLNIDTGTGTGTDGSNVIGGRDMSSPLIVFGSYSNPWVTKTTLTFTPRTRRELAWDAGVRVSDKSDPFSTRYKSEGWVRNVDSRVERDKTFRLSPTQPLSDVGDVHIWPAKKICALFKADGVSNREGTSPMRDCDLTDPHSVSRGIPAGAYSVPVYDGFDKSQEIPSPREQLNAHNTDYTSHFPHVPLHHPSPKELTDGSQLSPHDTDALVEGDRTIRSHQGYRWSLSSEPIIDNLDDSVDGDSVDIDSPHNALHPPYSPRSPHNPSNPQHSPLLPHNPLHTHHSPLSPHNFLHTHNHREVSEDGQLNNHLPSSTEEPFAKSPHSLSDRGAEVANHVSNSPQSPGSLPPTHSSPPTHSPPALN